MFWETRKKSGNDLKAHVVAAKVEALNFPTKWVIASPAKTDKEAYHTPIQIGDHTSRDWRRLREIIKEKSLKIGQKRSWAAQAPTQL